MRFAKQIKRENEATRLLLVINGKFDRKEIMKSAWERARRLAAFIGGKASEFIGQALKETWAIAKGF